MAKRCKANYQRAADTFDAWRDDVLSGERPVLYPIGVGDLARIEIGPGLVSLVGGPPGAGKTAFAMQAVFDALRLTLSLKACVCSVEMSPRVLLDRQLARISGVDLTTIRRRQLAAEHAERIDRAMNTIEPLVERLCFVRPPFDLENVAAVADDFEAGMLLLDYIQRIPPPGQHNDRRSSVDATMDFLRKFADAGMAVMVVAAVARTKDSRGRSSYAADGLSLASFRESSELEFGADDAFMLAPELDTDIVTLRHLKARHSEPRDISLIFRRRCQRFSPVAADRPSPNGYSNANALEAIWNSTTPAKDGDHGTDH